MPEDSQIVVGPDPRDITYVGKRDRVYIAANQPTQKDIWLPSGYTVPTNIKIPRSSIEAITWHSFTWDGMYKRSWTLSLSDYKKIARDALGIELKEEVPKS